MVRRPEFSAIDSFVPSEQLEGGVGARISGISFACPLPFRCGESACGNNRGWSEIESLRRRRYGLVAPDARAHAR